MIEIFKKTPRLRVERDRDMFEAFFEDEHHEERGYEDIVVVATYNVSRFIETLQEPLTSDLRGEKLISTLIKTTKDYEKFILDKENPTIFDEIAEIVSSESRGIAIREIDLKYELVKQVKPYEWLLHVGLTLITIGAVIFIAGLK